MREKRFRRNLLAWAFILFSACVALVAQWDSNVNKYYDLEELNAFHWQKHMNEDEFSKVKQGMSYWDVAKAAKGQGQRVAEGVYIWEDEILLTQRYEMHFQEGKLQKKAIIKSIDHQTE
ncbi:hypothetical protein D1B33_16675 [Lysinibacillus yapensis]|uniref:DUF3139 domain-containing protein n=1 Tax=Ureibacillus yapensis TaxID=2304605 RepID=A0A396SI97_9BACL|nr:hypothetical protein [Lysinibacillus yapensis]RHW32369.1 hypothetical protein D1B33_16675 [Lysinibacillus yapensis]